MKVIKAETDYENALAAIGDLMDADPTPGSPEADKVEVLSVLVEDYERRQFPTTLPDPIEALRFRMEQHDLTQRDLVPLIGSRSKVSEVLARKRPLTLSMIRALHSRLGIPARVLLKDRGQSDLMEENVEWERFPLREMISRGWIEGKPGNLNDQAEDMVRAFFSKVQAQGHLAFLCRKGMHHIRSARNIDEFALAAWSARIAILASEQPPDSEYRPGTVDVEFMKQVAQLSWSDSGPVLAREFLNKHGISLIIEPHLPRTHLDGAALSLSETHPVIGLTIRYDRIDNFWYSLMHELAHVGYHLHETSDRFFDDLELAEQIGPLEAEADEKARDALIPAHAWNSSPASKLPTPEAAQHLASKLQIHPAIVAGRIRFERKSYRVLNQLVGHRQVRCHFPEVDWPRSTQK